MKILPANHDSQFDKDSIDRFARPIFEVPENARLFDFGVEHNRDGEPIVAPFSDPEFNRLIETLPEDQAEIRWMPDRPPYSQAVDWGIVLGLTASVWQILGLPGALQVGQRTRDWLRARK